MRVVKKVAIIREKVAEISDTVRRTRTEIMKYFSKDLEQQNVKFPEVENPEPLFYELNDVEGEEVFNTSRPCHCQGLSAMPAIRPCCITKRRPSTSLRNKDRN